MVETLLATGPTHRSAPTHRIGGTVSLQFLGLEIKEDGQEIYEVFFRQAAGSAWQEGQLRHLGGSSWVLVDGQEASRETFELGSPDEVFALALGQPALTPETVAWATPHWPAALHVRLSCRRASGACTIAFDGSWFLSRLIGSAIDRPLLLPDAAVKLGLGGLLRASKVIAAAAAQRDNTSLIELLRCGLEAAATGTEPVWRGDGRLIGESTWGDRSQVGANIAEGCQAALGNGPLRVSFDPQEPMGLGFGPEVPSAEVAAGRQHPIGASVGTGAEVGVVDPGGAAEAAGLMPGMVTTGLSSLLLSLDGAPTPFEDILEAIDTCRDAGDWLVMTFDTAAPLTHWYAVEMPAASTLAALGASTGTSAELQPDDAGVGASFDALCGSSLLWREPIPRLFLGAPGSVTCAHVDICPQVQLAHALHGTKVLGVASHAATPRLSAEHGAADEGGASFDERATSIPTDRPLSARQARLLCDLDISLLWLQQGDLAVLHSGALHFASNGAEGLGASLYHGVITPAALPRLRAAAAAPGGSGADGDDPYAEHLFAAELLGLVELRLMADGQES